jgi:hypothetical protein
MAAHPVRVCVVNVGDAARRMIRLLALSGTVRVVVCPLCAALVVAEGVRQHEHVHATERRRGGLA